MSNQKQGYKGNRRFPLYAIRHCCGRSCVKLGYRHQGQNPLEMPHGHAVFQRTHDFNERPEQSKRCHHGPDHVRIFGQTFSKPCECGFVENAVSLFRQSSAVFEQFQRGCQHVGPQC